MPRSALRPALPVDHWITRSGLRRGRVALAMLASSAPPRHAMPGSTATHDTACAGDLRDAARRSEGDGRDSRRIEGEAERRFAPVREVFARSFATGEVGAAVCVTIGGRVVIDLWGGHRDAARTQPWTRDTLVNVYSTTKGMTAICANRLVERGPPRPRCARRALLARVRGRRARTRSRCAGCCATRPASPRCARTLPRDALFDWKFDGPRRWPPRRRGGSRARGTATTRSRFGHLVGELVRRVDGRSLGTLLPRGARAAARRSTSTSGSRPSTTRAWRSCCRAPPRRRALRIRPARRVLASIRSRCVGARVQQSDRWRPRRRTRARGARPRSRR